MDGMNVKSLEERSEGDVASPSSTGTQVQSSEFIYPFFHLLNSREYRNIRLVSPISGSDIVNIEYAQLCILLFVCKEPAPYHTNCVIQCNRNMACV